MIGPIRKTLHLKITYSPLKDFTNIPKINVVLKKRGILLTLFPQKSQTRAATWPTNVNRSDYSFAQEKLHPGTAGNDEALFRL